MARKGRCKMVRIINRSGETVGKGNYWNFATGDRVHMDVKGVLPGRPGDTYYKAPPAVILAVGPVLGLIYAVFLPFIGIAMLLKIAARKVFGGAVETAWKGATFSWKPSEAYLAGKKAKKGEERTEDEKKE